MNRWLRSLAGVLFAFALGMAAWFAIGSGPRSTLAAAPARTDAWRLPAATALPLEGPRQVWGKRQPWDPPPAMAGEASDVPEPVAIPVGVAVADGKPVAVFLSPDGTLARLKPGQSIADGGRVDAVTRFHVSWTDARGTKHEQELLADPLPSQVALP